MEIQKLREELKHALEYDSATGKFKWKASLSNRVKPGENAGFIHQKHGRLLIGFKNRGYQATHLAWLLTHGEWPSGVIDHVDGNPLNNRIDNLRDVPRSLNNQNQRGAQVKNKTGYLGVSWHKVIGKYHAQIQCLGHKKHLGYFSTPEEAHAVYLAAKREFHEGCTI